MTKGLTDQDTVCAVATPPGRGAIAVVRLSGPGAIEICSKFFRSRKRGTDLAGVPTHTVHFGTFGDQDGIIDEVLVTVFRAPQSYTGEDSIEISCHGSAYIQQKIMEMLISGGARLAGPGEFTLRAFSNGKFDLSQAEAVADLIAASAKSSHDLALDQMRGGFSARIASLRAALLDFASLIALELDFSEEDVEFADRGRLAALLEELAAETERLIGSFQAGNVIRSGIPVAIIGRPNVGKSTLLNALLNEERAIVSEIPGTTRDTVEDMLTLGNYQFRIMDTAGLRHATDKIETAGIERTYEKISQAKIVLYVFDVTTADCGKISHEIESLMDHAPGDAKTRRPEDLSPATPGRHAIGDKTVIPVANKIDKLEEPPVGLKAMLEMDCVFVSAKRKENIRLVLEKLVESARQLGLGDAVMVSNIRHLEALQAARAAITDIQAGLGSGLTGDLLSTDIQKALYHLGEITGAVTTDEILHNIFSKFCIGK
jgi:tRNA modification GTPase